MRVGEPDELGDRPLLRIGVRIRDQDVLARRRRDPHVDVRREREPPLVLEHANAFGDRADAPGNVGDDEEIVDLGRERRQRALQLGGVPVRDDDRGDLQRPSQRPSASR